MSRLEEGRSSSLLCRHSQFSHSDLLSQNQLEIDGLGSAFSHEAGNFSNLLAMAGGSFAYRLGKFAFMSMGAGRPFSTLSALGAEVTAFRGATNLFANLRGEQVHENVFDLKGWMGTFTSFGLLKAAGRIAEGQNLFFSHTLQSSSMVAGNQLTYALGLSYQPEGSLLQQFLHAETTNIAMLGGNTLLGAMTGHRLGHLEQSLELRTRVLGARAQLRSKSLSDAVPVMSSGERSVSGTPAPLLQKLSPVFEVIREGKSHEEVAAALREAAITLEDVLPYTDFPNPEYAKTNYARSAVFNDGKIEALVLGWRPGQYTRVHEHRTTENGIASVAEVSIQGSAGEARFEKRDGVWTEFQRATQAVGDVMSGAEGLYHMIFNAGEGNMITVHIYWPPLDLTKGVNFFRDPFAIPLPISNRALATEMPGPATVSGWVRELQEQGATDVVNLGMGQNGFPPEAHVRRAAAEAALERPATYGPVAGQPELLEAIRQKYWPYGLKYDNEEILVSGGGKASLTFACQAIFNEGDRAIIMGPAWPSYRDEVRLAGGHPVILLGSRERAFRITAEQLERSIQENPQTKAIILTNPSNPTGVHYTRTELESFAELARKYNLIVIADEIYDGHVYQGEFVPFASLPGMRQRTVTMNGGSKVYSLAGWRVTYLTGPRDLIQGATRLQAHEAANTDTLAQAALNAGLRGDQSFIRSQVQAFERRARVITERLNEMGLTTAMPEAAFYAFADVNKYLDTITPEGREIKTDIDLAKYILQQAHVAVVPGTYFFAPGNFRLAFGGVEVEQIHVAMDRVQAALRSLKPRENLPPEGGPPSASSAPELRHATPPVPQTSLMASLREKLAPYAVPALGLMSMWQGMSSGMALAAGLATALTVGNPYSEQTSKITKPLLAASIIAMGAGVDLHAVANAGIHGFGYTLGGIALTLGLGKLLSRVTGLERNQRRMIDGGTAICGGSAIAAIYQALGLKAKDPSVSVALGTVFGLNSLALYLFPWIGHHLNMSQHEFGLWSALAIHDTSSVVGAASSYGPEALEVATTVKLARALWIMPLVAAMNAWDRRSANTNAASGPTPAFPKFILGFLATAAATTFIPELKPAGDFFAHRAQETMRLTLFLLGANLNLQSLRQVGAKPLLHGTSLWLTMGGLTLLGIEQGWIR